MLDLKALSKNEDKSKDDSSFHSKKKELYVQFTESRVGHLEDIIYRK